MMPVSVIGTVHLRNLFSRKHRQEMRSALSLMDYITEKYSFMISTVRTVRDHEVSLGVSAVVCGLL